MALECGGCDVVALKTHLKVLAALVFGSLLAAFATVWQCIPLEGSLFLAALPLSVVAYEGKWYVKPVCVYVCVCSTFVFREVFVVALSSVPCGLCQFRSQCLESESQGDDGQCTHWGSDIERCWQVTTNMDGSYMLWGSIPALLGCLGFMLHLLRRFYVAELQQWLQARVAVILMIPTTYAICSFYSLRLLTVNDSDLWTAKAIYDVSELYVALSLLAFMYLCIGCARRACENIEHEEENKRRGSWQSQARMIEAELEYNQKAWEIGKGLMCLGCWPYVIVCFFGNLVEIIMKEFINFWMPGLCGEALPVLVQNIFPTLTDGHLKPPDEFVAFQFHRGSLACQEFWGAVSPTVTAMNFLVCTIAVTCIVSYEQALGNVLESISPKAKFMAVKGLLLVSFWQKNILPLVYPGEEAVQARINSFLICWESFLLAIYQWRSYDPNHFKEVATVDDGTRSDSVMLRLSRSITGFSGLGTKATAPGRRSDDPTVSIRSETTDAVSENGPHPEEDEGSTCSVS